MARDRFTTLAIVMALPLLVCACMHEGPTVGPTPQESPGLATAAAVGGAVIDQSTAQCIANATVEVVSGPLAGTRQTQKAPCDAWNPYGFVVGGLPPGVAVTLRGSAPGYGSAQITVVPSGHAALLELPRID